MSSPVGGPPNGPSSRTHSSDNSRSSSCSRPAPAPTFSSSRLRAQAERQAAAATDPSVTASSNSATSCRPPSSNSSSSSKGSSRAKVSNTFLALGGPGCRGRRGGQWCYICRDSMTRNEDNAVECTACPKRFHLECLQHEGVIQAGERVSLDDWLCPQCLEEHEEDEIQNDERCFICKRKEPEDGEEDRLLMCDGCPNSYHMRACLKLTIEPDEEKWFCPECNPSGFKRDEIRRLGRGRAQPGIGPGGEEIVNSSTCYVCQRPGKLLGCDFCVNSFHPTCLVDVDWDAIGDEWECPVCKGRDPLANQMHKRWSRAEIEAKSKERIKCLDRIRIKTTRYRNRFLLVHQKELGPFVNPKILAYLAKSLRGQVTQGGSSKRRQEKGGGRLQVERSMQDLLESLEDEAMEESEKFVKRAYKVVRHPSGRKIEGVPLREGIELKPHQVDGVEWLLRSFMTGGGILADEMGLGKTIQTLCFLSYLNAMKLEGPHLIVVPLSTVGNWMREVHRFTPSLTHIKICGSRAERQHAMEDRLAQKGLYDLYITTYETVKSEEEFFVETIPHWQCIVLDEAHRIKNASGAVRHALDRVVGNMRLLLTGTPLQNNAAELFTLINFLMPDVFRDSQLLEQAFVANPHQSNTATPGKNNSVASKSGGGGARGGGAGSGSSSGRGTPVVEVDKLFRQEDLEAIRNLLDRVMLRRLKEQAIALPKKSFHSVWLPLSGPAAQWYARLLKIKALQEAGKDKLSDSSYRKMLGLVIKMRIICAHPKAICARESQIQKLQAFFMDEETEMQSEVLNAARDTQRIEGDEHIAWSAKLTFLDKLMCHLHFLNCKYVPGYEKVYEDHRRESATYRFYKHHEELCKEEVAAGRKAPRRPKRAELMGLEEFRYMLERGNPRLAPGVVRTADDPDYLEEGMYPAELQMPQMLLEPASSSPASLSESRLRDGVKAENGGDGMSPSRNTPDKIVEADLDDSREKAESEADDLTLSNISSCTGGAGRRRRVLDYDDDDDDGTEKGEEFPRSSIVNNTKRRGLVILDDEDEVIGLDAPSGSAADSRTPQSKLVCGTRSTSASSASSPPATSPGGEDRRDSLKQEENCGLGEPSDEKLRSSTWPLGNECAESGRKEEPGLFNRPPGLRKATSGEDDMCEGLSTACCTTNSATSTFEGGQWLKGTSADGGDCDGTTAGSVKENSLSSRIKKEYRDEVAAANLGQGVKPEAVAEARPAETSMPEPNQGECRSATVPLEKEKEEGVEKKEFVIDRSQPKLQRLLVFSQFQLVLDELEAYCQFRGWKYLRLDGLTNKFVRELDIRDFNSEGSTYFIYLISTRAGGLGINLTAANHVVLYDHDWNPFIDLQAIDRAHRIGQQREVHVWSLVNEWTVEERMAFRREQKLRLDKLLVQHQQEEAMIDEDEEERQQSRSEKISTDEIRKLMLHGKTAIVEVAAKRATDITCLSLEELASRQRLPLPETVLESATEEERASITRLDAEEVEDDDTKDEENLVDIDEVMNEEAEEQQKEQSLEAADGEGDAGVLSRGGSSNNASGLVTPPKEADDVAANSEEREEDMGESGNSQNPAPAEEKTGVQSVDVEAGEKQEEDEVAGGGAGINGAAKGGKGDLEKELQNAGVLWRSGRERKKPIAVYVPQEFGQREERKKIKHEQKCFICGNGKDFEQTIVDSDGKTTKIALGDLVTCSGCPRAYHRACEGLPKDIKRSWRCRWHECCICFRKTSQCGNMLIHCAKCPTSFCYDCFPPDYCRYNVGEEYYSQLRQRGMNVTPQNWILLLCSRCKAVEEQQTRRRLTKEEKEQEKQQQKELRQQQKELHFELEGPKKGKDGGRRHQEGKQKAEEERQFFEAKQQIDLEESRQEDELRQSYQRLFPAAFIDELNKRVTAARVAQKAHRCATMAGAGGSFQGQEPTAHGGAGTTACGAGSGVTGRANGLPGAEEQNVLQVAASGGTGGGPAGAVAAALGKKGQQAPQKRPVNQLANMKLPGAALGLCENCHLPCHGVKDYPSPCCFPSEIQSKFFLRHPAVTSRGNHGREGLNACSNGSPAGGALLASPSQGSSRLSTTVGMDDDCISAASSSPENVQLDTGEQAGRGTAETGKGIGQSQEKLDVGMAGGSTGARESEKGSEVSQGSPQLTGGGGLTGKGGVEFIASLAAAAGLTLDVITSGVDTLTASRITAVGGGPEQIKFVHRQVCACCGDSRIGRKAHLRKHCPSLCDADKQEYVARRAKVRQLIQRLQQHPPIPDTSNVNGYAGASPQRLKWYYHQYQDQADRILEEAMIAVGLEAAVAPRASGGKRTYPVSSIHGGNSVRPSPSQLLLQNDGNLTADSSCGRKRGGDGALPKRQPSQGTKRPGRSPKGGRDSASNSDVEVVNVVRIHQGKGVSLQAQAGNSGKGSDGNVGRGGNSKLAATNPWTAPNHTAAYGRLTLLKAVAAAAASGQVTQDSAGAATGPALAGSGSGNRGSVDVPGKPAGGMKRGLNENSGGVTPTSSSGTDNSPGGLLPTKRRKPASASGPAGTSNAEACSSGESEGCGSGLLLGTPATTSTLQSSAPVRQQKSIIDFFYARNSRGGAAPNSGGSAMAALAALAVARQHATGMGGSGVPRTTGN